MNKINKLQCQICNKICKTLSGLSNWWEDFDTFGKKKARQKSKKIIREQLRGYYE
jgi:hypothetical protein